MRRFCFALLLAVIIAAAPPAHAAKELFGFMAGTGTAGRPVAVCGADSAGYFWIVTGVGPGERPLVQLWRGYSGGVILADSWDAYDPGFTGGVWVDCREIWPYFFISTGAGPEGGPHVKMWYVPIP